jgi:host cell factor
MGNDVQISWEPPQNAGSQVKEYAVFLAMKSQQHQQQQQANNVNKTNQMTFTQVYAGVEPSCIINSELIGQAHIDSATKPAILFRIAAKNEKGYGPATQVRWVQEVTSQASANNFKRSSLNE